LAVADAVVLQFDPFSSAAALSSTLSLGRRTSGTRLGMVDVSSSSEGAIRGANRGNHAHVPSFLLPLAGTGSGSPGYGGLSAEQARRTTLLAPLLLDCPLGREALVAEANLLGRRPPRQCQPPLRLGRACSFYVGP